MHIPCPAAECMLKQCNEHELGLNLQELVLALGQASWHERQP